MIKVVVIIYEILGSNQCDDYKIGNIEIEEER